MNCIKLGALDETEARASELLKQNEYCQALTLYREAELKGLQSAVLCTRRTEALTNLKRWKEAAALIEEKLGIYPNEPANYTALTFLLLKMRKPGETLEVWDYARSIGVWNRRPSINEGVVLFCFRKKKEAASLVERELEKCPDEIYLHFNLGLAYLLLARKTESEQEIGTALAALVEKGAPHE